LGAQTVLCALLMSAGFAVVAPAFVSIFFGAKFHEAATLVALIGVLQTTRFLIVWPVTVSLSAAKSANILIGNISRLIVVPTSVAGHLLIGGLAGVVIGFAVGECISLMVALATTNRSIGAPILEGFSRVALFAAASCVVVGWAWVAEHPSATVAAILAVTTAGLGAWLYRTERAAAADLLVAARHFVGVNPLSFTRAREQEGRAS
jgi:hypothetical protein